MVLRFDLWKVNRRTYYTEKAASHKMLKWLTIWLIFIKCIQLPHLYNNLSQNALISKISRLKNRIFKSLCCLGLGLALVICFAFPHTLKSWRFRRWDIIDQLSVCFPHFSSLCFSFTALADFKSVSAGTGSEVGFPSSALHILLMAFRHKSISHMHHSLQSSGANSWSIFWGVF